MIKKSKNEMKRAQRAKRQREDERTMGERASAPRKVGRRQRNFNDIMRIAYLHTRKWCKTNEPHRELLSVYMAVFGRQRAGDREEGREIKLEAPNNEWNAP